MKENCPPNPFDSAQTAWLEAAMTDTSEQASTSAVRTSGEHCGRRFQAVETKVLTLEQRVAQLENDSKQEVVCSQQRLAEAIQ
eukprot:6261423-Karenia_brevis.AAC.1